MNNIIKNLENLKRNINNIKVDPREYIENLKRNTNNIKVDPREYIIGLYNGYEIALSLIENRKPVLKKAEIVDFNDIFHTGFNIDTDSLNEKAINNNNGFNFQDIPEKFGYKGFEKDIEQIINANCIENFSNTPDFILSEFLTAMLKAFAKTINARDKWYDFNPWDENIIEKEKK